MADPSDMPLHPGVFLKRRFLEPLALSATALSQATGLTPGRVRRLLAGQGRITPEVAHRLALALGTSPLLWMELQARFELARCPVAPEAVTPLDTRGFLVGPERAQPMPPAPLTSPPPVARLSASMVERLRAQVSHAPPPPPRTLVHVIYPDGQQAWISQES